MQFNAFAVYSAGVGVAAEVIPEMQKSDYESGIVQIGEEAWHIRTARNTPTKPGAFVAFWQRDAEGNTTPFSADDPAAGLLSPARISLSSASRQEGGEASVGSVYIRVGVRA